MREKDNTSWEQKIREALTEPVDDPGPDFAHRVIRGIDESRESTVPATIRPLAAAGALALVAAALLTLRPDPQPEVSAEDRIRSLAREQQQLTRELEDLRRLRLSAEPVVYLGGDDRVEFVYALDDPRLAGGQSQTNNDYRTANR